MSALTPARRALWPALAFAACALGFAALRIPYDDEWFSLQLAAEHDSMRFWRALRSDVHPPWLAMLDRGLHAWFASWHAPSAVRVACAAAALALVAPLLAARLRVPSWVPWLAALHPIVLMYAGSVRWYPVVMLGQALRVRALWSDGARPRTRLLLFTGGAVVGAIGGYIDAWFVLHDAVFWTLSSMRRERRAERWLALAAGSCAAGAVLGVRLLSPLGLRHALPVAPAPSLQSIVTFFGVGTLFEAAPPWPWTSLALVVPVVLALGLLRCVRAVEPPARSPLAYAASLGCAWLLATQLGAWHPRYALLFFWLLFALALAPAYRVRWVRIGFTLVAAYTACVLVFMGLGRGFVKGDLNTLTREDCAVLERGKRPALALVPYVRLAALIGDRCEVAAPIAGAPSIRIQPRAEEQLRGVRAEVDRLARPAEVWLIRGAVHSSQSSTDARVRALLVTRCLLQEVTPFAPMPHADLLERLRESTEPFRYARERWVCL